MKSRCLLAFIIALAPSSMAIAMSSGQGTSSEFSFSVLAMAPAVAQTSAVATAPQPEQSVLASDTAVRHANKRLYSQIGRTPKSRTTTCPICNKAFARTGHLTVHMRRHTGEKPYVCKEPGCDKAFAQMSEFTVHMRRRHTREKPHVCTVAGCGIAFTQRSQLAVHMRTHTGEKPYVCKEPGCGKAFIQRGNLTQHMRRHHPQTSTTQSQQGTTQPEQGPIFEVEFNQQVQPVSLKPGVDWSLSLAQSILLDQESVPDFPLSGLEAWQPNEEVEGGNFVLPPFPS